ncbi:MAG: hypothetical protein ACRD2O_06255 [Terriglobia bacterium]
MSRFQFAGRLIGSSRGPQIAIRAALGLAAAVMLAACHPRHIPARPYLAFIANQGSDSVAVVDLGTFSVTKVIGVTHHPNLMALRPHSHDLYVAGDTGIDILDYPGLRITGHWNFPGGVSALTFSPDGSRALLIEKPDGRIAGFDCAARRKMAVIKSPSGLTGLALTSNGKILVGEARSKDLVYFIDPDTQQILGSVKTGRNPGSMVISPDNSKVYIADTGENLITVADIPARALLAHLEISNPPTLLILKPDGGEIFALSASGTRMTMLDVSQATVEEMKSTGHGAAAGVFSQDSSRFYWANEGDGTVSSMDVSTRQVLASTRVGVAPQGLALTPDGRFLMAIDGGSSSVEVVEAASTHLLTTIPVGAQPVSVIIPGWQP